MTRALALALDVTIQVLLGIGLALVVAFALPDLDTDAMSAVALLGGVAIIVGLPTVWESLSRGRSPGKAAAGLRVVRDDGGPIRFRHALIRALVGVGEIWLLSGGPALISSLVSRQSKRIGDLLAGTVVMRERSTGVRVRPPAMPPELAGWASTADIGRLREDIAITARAVLARAGRLDEDSRTRLLDQLAARVAPLVAPPPPPGTSAERFLAAVLAQRRERERAQWQRARARRDALDDASRRLQGI